MNSLLLLPTMIVAEKDNPDCNRQMIIKVDDRDVLLTELRSGHTKSISRADLVEMQQSGLVEVLAASSESREVSIDQLPKHEQDSIQRKLLFVTAIDDAGLRSVTQKSESVIQATAARQGYDVPCWGTVRKWHEAWVEANRTIEGLISKVHRRGNRTPRLNHTVYSLMDEVAELVLSKAGRNVQTAYRLLCFRIEELNKASMSMQRPQASGEAECLQPPSVETLRQFISSKSYESKQRRSTSANAYRRQLAAAKSPHETASALSVVEIDETELDLYCVVSGEEKTVARPWLVAIIDRHSGLIIGYCISFHKADASAVLGTLLNAFRSKVKFVDEHAPGAEWPAEGVPETLVVDNGKEYWSESVARALASLTVVIQFCPVKTPHLKGMIERFFETVKTELLDALPGVIRKPHTTSDAYDPKSEATLTIDEFRKIFAHWLLNDFHHTVASNKTRTPIEAWRESVSSTPPRIVGEGTLTRTLLPSREVTIQRNGVTFNKLNYSSPALTAIYGRGGKLRTSIRYNPLDLGEVLVHDPVNRNDVVVPVCERDAYKARGVSLAERKDQLRSERSVRSSKNNSPSLLNAKNETARLISDAHEKKPLDRPKNGRRAAQRNERKERQFREIEAPGYPFSATDNDADRDERFDESDWGDVL